MARRKWLKDEEVEILINLWQSEPSLLDSFNSFIAMLLNGKRHLTEWANSWATYTQINELSAVVRAWTLLE